MITDIDVWKFIHILLFVYWLGADLGVFLLAKAAQRSDLTFDQRVIALRMALKIDILPRLSFALMFPVGLELSAALGLVEPCLATRAISWAVSALWVAIVIGMVRADGKPGAAALRRGQRPAALDALCRGGRDRRHVGARPGAVSTWLGRAGRSSCSH